MSVQHRSVEQRARILCLAVFGVVVLALSNAEGQVSFRRGDSNADGVFDVSDPVYSLMALFVIGSPQPSCAKAADANDDGLFNVADPSFSLASLFIVASPQPPSPGPSTCGVDPTADSLECVAYTPCAPPTELTYSNPMAEYFVGVEIQPNQPSVSGGPVDLYEVVPALPDGLSIDPDSGVISGTPTVLQPFQDYAIVASGGTGSTFTTIQIAIVAPMPPTSISYPAPPGMLIAGYDRLSLEPTVIGIVDTFAIIPALPDGLELDTSTGVLSGVALVESPTTDYLVTASNPFGSVFTIVTFQVILPTPPMGLQYPESSLTAYVDVPFSLAPYPMDFVTYEVTPDLPPGSSLDPSTGVISGTPTVETPEVDYQVTVSNLGGSASTILTLSTPIPPTPFLLPTDPLALHPGQVIAVEVLGYDPVPSNNRVDFRTDSGAVVQAASVVSVTPLGLTPSAQLPRAEVEVSVPSGVPYGVLEYRVHDPISGVTSVSPTSISFSIRPQIVGFSAGRDREPFLVTDLAGQLVSPELQVYGIGSLGLSPDVDQPDGVDLTGVQLLFGDATAPTVPLAPGFEVRTLFFDSPTTITAPCVTSYLRVNTADFGEPSNSIIVPVRQSVAAGEYEDLPGTIVGCSVPSGVRTGVVPITFLLAMDPPQSSYDVEIDWYDDTQLPGSEWQPCTGLSVDEGAFLHTGAPIAPSGLPAIVGGGALHTFYWDTEADLPSEVRGTRLRFRIVDPNPVPFICETFSLPGVHYESPDLAIDNSVSPSATVREEFGDDTYLDTVASPDAAWGSGQLTTGDDPVPLPWGEGTLDVVLAAGEMYELNTDLGSLVDLTSISGPVTLVPGSGSGTLDCRTFVQEAGASLTIVGSGPVVIRCSGVGDPATVVVSISGAIDLDGSAGAPGSSSSPAAGGGAGPGGGPGGDGGWIETSPTGVVIGQSHATAGGNSGGRAGRNVTLARIGSPSSAAAGPGGGGGAMFAGGDGVVTLSSSIPQESPGRGGPRRGDVAQLAFV
ncbi:MAG: putative Ig domain-containing protein, partial [Planctomycetes bacterium]|nr:putative Ig domain-containing protein [Planctomycetota bacterium]